MFTIFSGKSSALGHKQPCPNGQWNELAITKASKFVQCAVGHEGGHSLLLTEDGIVYFVGIPRRGEDGDQTKARRILKPSKPKIFNRMDGQFVSYVSQIFVLFQLFTVFLQIVSYLNTSEIPLGSYFPM